MSILFIVIYVIVTRRDVPAVVFSPEDVFTVKDMQQQQLLHETLFEDRKEEEETQEFSDYPENHPVESEELQNALIFHYDEIRKHPNEKRTEFEAGSVSGTDTLVKISKNPSEVDDVNQIADKSESYRAKSNSTYVSSSHLQRLNFSIVKNENTDIIRSDGQLKERQTLNSRIGGLLSVGVVNISGFSDKPYPPFLIEGNGTFMERLHSYNVVIEKVKKEIDQLRGFKEWQDVKEPNELTVVWGSVDDFLERLSNHKEVITLVLPWRKISRHWSSWDSTSDISNVLVKEYFEWSASQPLCEWIETPGFTKAHWDAVYNRTCNVDMRLTARPRSLEWLYFHGKPINAKHYWPNEGLSYPSSFYVSPPLAIFYINILQDAVINLSGDVISGGIKVVPYTCSHDYIPTIPIEYRERPIYRDVFVVTQFWGRTYFHKMLEVMPRVAAYVEFLKNNPSILIHAPEDHAQFSELLEILGLNPERIVTGVTRAKCVYLPKGTPCGFPNAHELQLLSHHYRNFIHTSLSANPRNRLVLIKRSGQRRFLQQDAIEQVLRAIAPSYGLNFTLFSDNPSPSFRDTMSIFNSAAVIVAPHGAGLSNMVFSEPRTLIVEGVCNPPHMNMCFQFAAHSLGHRYHGIPSERGCESVVSIAPETIDAVVRELMDVDSSTSRVVNRKNS